MCFLEHGARQQEPDAAADGRPCIREALNRVPNLEACCVLLAGAYHVEVREAEHEEERHGHQVSLRRVWAALHCLDACASERGNAERDDPRGKCRKVVQDASGDSMEPLPASLFSNGVESGNFPHPVPELRPTFPRVFELGAEGQAKLIRGDPARVYVQKGPEHAPGSISPPLADIRQIPVEACLLRSGGQPGRQARPYGQRRLYP
eukprot:GHVR01146362.1.p2 GENE.GHVR01146362.1~~GHVR01146362.1.p2  ORF type:complete len:206 (+),score=20.55 GHVR01146362.1:236-853(+)